MTAALPEICPGGFVRDTLCFNFGELARTVAEDVFEDQHLQRVYSELLEFIGDGTQETKQGPGHTLVQSGFEQDGTLYFQARHRPDEFLLICQHQHFECVLCVGFESKVKQLIGIHLALFKGDADLGIHWAQKMVRHLDRERKSRKNVTPVWPQNNRQNHLTRN